MIYLIYFVLLHLSTYTLHTHTHKHTDWEKAADPHSQR